MLRYTTDDSCWVFCVSQQIDLRRVEMTLERDFLLSLKKILRILSNFHTFRRHLSNGKTLLVFIADYTTRMGENLKEFVSILYNIFVPFSPAGTNCHSHVHSI